MNRILNTAAAIAAIIIFAQCSDWVTPERKYSEPVNIKDEAYYEALRAYKMTDHSVCFGWYSGWTGTGTDMYGQLRGIPDSMDMVSIWGDKTNLTAEMKADMQEVQQLKGTKVLWCQHIQDIGREITPESVTDLEAYWGWNGSSYDGSEQADAAIRKYAKAIVDKAIQLGYDGCDFDYEPNYGYRGNISGSPEAMHVFLSEVAKYMGPKSGSRYILAVDGEPQTLLTESGPLLDYYIIQSYYCSGDHDLDTRFQRLMDRFGSVEDEATILRKTIWCEDFEKHKQDGGPKFTTRDGVETYSLMGMAMYYRPTVPDTRIGGVGAYRFNLCRPVNDYLFMRQVIQKMNPAQK